MIEPIGAGPLAGHRRAILAIECHRHARHAGLSWVLDAVPVRVVPDSVADRCRRLRQVEPGVDRRIQLTGRQVDHMRPACLGNGVAVCKICNLHLRAQLVASWRDELDLVVARCEVGKKMLALCIGDLFGDQHTCGAVELHRHTRHTDLAWVLHAVAIAVVPDRVAQARRLYWQRETQIPAGIIFPCHQHRRNRLAGHRGGVAVGRIVCPNILRADRVACWRHKLHRVVFGDQIRKRIVAVETRLCLADHSAAGIEQLDRHARHTCLVRILDAIFVGVIPDPVAQTRRLHRQVQTQVPGPVGPPGGQSGLWGTPCGWVDVAVRSVVSSCILRADQIPGRRHKLQAVVASRQIGKQIVAICICGRRGDYGPAVVEQLDRHTRHTALRRILDPILVAVVPDVVADTDG